MNTTVLMEMENLRSASLADLRERGSSGRCFKEETRFQASGTSVQADCLAASKTGRGRWIHTEGLTCVHRFSNSSFKPSFPPPSRP